MLSDILGNSPAVVNMRSKIERVAKLNGPVLILGEPGVGKELVARAVHQLSPRRGPLVTTNCGSIERTLASSEFFGYAKGAFTGASSEEKGLFERAQGGSLFLDEIGELLKDVQSSLLRVLQNSEIERVGARGKTIKIDVRVIAATNVDLQKATMTKAFRSDLYERLNVLRIDVPPLRQRKEDIPLLVQALTARHNLQLTFDEDALTYLVNYRWPGNIRQLENVLQQLSVESTSSHVSLDLARQVLDDPAPSDCEPTSSDVEIVASNTSSPTLENFDRVLSEVVRSQTIAFEAALDRSLGAIVSRLAVASAREEVEAKQVKTSAQSSFLSQASSDLDESTWLENRPSSGFLASLSDRF